MDALYNEILKSLPEDQRYELEERAAIYEFDGRCSREMAEFMAALAWMDDQPSPI